MSSFLMVPVHLDALVLKNDRAVVEAAADFSRLPYYNGTRDVNPDIANISEKMLSVPFQNKNLHLKAGIHLHWSLPDALTRENEGDANFPGLPNRWLVIRSKKSSPHKKTWIVESDYLYPPGQESNPGSVCILYPPSDKDKTTPPFRYLGRKMTLDQWREMKKGNTSGDEYMEPFTAIGYGDPTFAAFYPHCLSMFGLYDPDYSDPLPEGLQYDVIGWYSDPGKDYLGDFKNKYREENPTNRELLEALEENFQWTATIEQGEEFPDRMLCYARLTFKPDDKYKDALGTGKPDITVAVGNTGPEALSAFLAHTLAESLGTGKPDLEEKLEAFHMASLLGQRKVDIRAAFKEARHLTGFNAYAAGSIWSIRPGGETVKPAETMNTAADFSRLQLTLPEAMAGELNDLNVKQQAYDRGLLEIESLRRRLFADWYKYMLCAYPPEDAGDDYPDIDEVKFYIETKDMAELEEKISEMGQLVLKKDETGKIIGADTPGSSRQSLAFQLKQTLERLLQSIETYNNSKEVKEGKTACILKQLSGPRFWQPREPVVLIAGETTKPTDRHGQDGRLREDNLMECRVLQLPQPLPRGAAAEDLSNGNINAITGFIEAFRQAVKGEQIAFRTWEHQPWHPFLLEWEIEVFPLKDKSNFDPDTGKYDPGFIDANYQLPENEPDLSLKSKAQEVKAACVYSSSSILTPHAGVQLRKRVEEYLEGQDTLESFYSENNIPAQERQVKYLGQQIKDLKSWYESIKGKSAQDPFYIALCIYEAAQKMYALSQCLGGFNEELLMHKQTFQLRIDDPLGFDQYKEFTLKVGDLVQKSNQSAPEPMNDFNPVRTGSMKILHLRLVDTFGRSVEVDCSHVVTAETMAHREEPSSIYLAPRLVQPARLNFRWLSAGRDIDEMNAHPATTPICGWVLPNNLDISLMIYDNNGKALGSIDQRTRWQPVPGTDDPISADDITNPHLKQMVKYLTSMGEDFLKNFILALDSALANIDPEGFVGHQDLALLMGRPIALVRASVNLELLGLPAVHQGWNSFRRDMRRSSKETDNFPNVRMPIRIGEFNRFNDGLVGYWKETAGRYEKDIFYASQGTAGEHKKIKTHSQGSAFIGQTIDAPPQTLAMLVDPRGSIHATCGILPIKSIRIPQDQYVSALQAMEITFLSTPILIDPGNPKLALPAEEGFQWSWLEKRKDGWKQVSSLKKADAASIFPGQQEIHEGWLKLSKVQEIKQ